MASSLASSSSLHTAIFRLPPPSVSSVSAGPVIPSPAPRVEIRSIPKPTISPGELLVRVAYAAIQPGDLMFLIGAFKMPVELAEPYAGVSAAGVVEAVGDDSLKHYVGKAVMIYRALNMQPTTIGTWSEYARISPFQCAVLPFPSSSLSSLLPFSGSLANAISSCAFLLDHVIPSGVGVLITAGASATGRAALAFCARLGVRAVALVRSATDADTLRQLQSMQPRKVEEGKDWWLVRSDLPSFQVDVTAAIQLANASVVFDCVTGVLLSSLLPCLLPDTRIYVYSVLDRSPIALPAMFLMQKRLSVQTFSIFRSDTARDISKLSKALEEISRVVADCPNHFHTNVGKVWEAQHVQQALNQASERYTTRRMVLDFTNGSGKATAVEAENKADNDMKP